MSNKQVTQDRDQDRNDGSQSESTVTIRSLPTQDPNWEQALCFFKSTNDDQALTSMFIPVGDQRILIPHRGLTIRYNYPFFLHFVPSQVPSTASCVRLILNEDRDDVTVDASEDAPSDICKEALQWIRRWLADEYTTVLLGGDDDCDDDEEDEVE